MSKRARALAGATAVSLGGLAVGGFGGFRPASTYAASISPRSTGLCSIADTVTVYDDTDLQREVAASNDGDIICIAPTADDTITLSAPLVLDDTALTLIGADDTPVVLQGPLGGDRHIFAEFDGVGGDDTLILSNLDFFGGSSIAGGSIYLKYGDALVVSSSGFHSNVATGEGGAIFAFYAAYISLTNTDFTHNTATNYFGGAISTRGGTVTTNGGTFDNNIVHGRSGGAIRVYRGSISTINTDFTNNTATANYGGAIGGLGGTSITTDGGRFEGNTAGTYGGAIFGDIAVTTTNTDFTNNTATNDSGGAISGVSGTITINGGSFTGNRAPRRGGAVNTIMGRVAIANGRFLGNTATSSGYGTGGAVAATNDISVSYTTFTANSAALSGGALASDDSVSVYNSTFYGNSAAIEGGSVFAADYLHLFFVTSVDDTAPIGAEVMYSPYAPTIVGSVIAPGLTGNACGTAANNGSLASFATDPSCGSGDDTINVSYSDRFALGFDDSITADDSVLVPSAGSPLIGAAPFNLVPGVTLDQLGATRGPVTTTVGAVQVAASPPTPPTPTPSTPPSAPLGPVAVAGDRSAAVTWTAPASTGSFPITTYQVTNDTYTTSCLLTVTEGTPLACTLTGLTNGTPYRFRVRALNGSGWGPWSDWTTPVTPEPVTKTLVITGTRGDVRGKPGVIVTGLTTGLDNQRVTPWLKFPGQTSYTEGNARPTINDDGTFTWTRKTSKKIRIYVTADNTRSNTILVKR